MISLTNREREIVFALAEGLSNKDVGQRLNLSEGTVKVHLHNIYRKLGVKNRTALAVLALTDFAWMRALPHTANSDFEKLSRNRLSASIERRQGQIGVLHPAVKSG